MRLQRFQDCVKVLWLDLHDDHTVRSLAVLQQLYRHVVTYMPWHSTPMHSQTGWLTPRKMISEFAAISAAPPSAASPYTRSPSRCRAFCLSLLRTLAEICSYDDTPDLQKPRIKASPICRSTVINACFVYAHTCDMLNCTLKGSFAFSICSILR